MYPYYSPSFECSLAQVDKKAQQFRGLRRPSDLSSLLKVTTAELKKFAAKPPYSVFQIPKPGGAKRIIHNPHPDLKAIQQNLNPYLQATYYQLKPSCAYGFIPRPTDEPNPRNIYTNAMRHLDANWVLNLDMKDYFHTITSRHLRWIFREVCEFTEPLSDQLSGLVACKGILPMGAPTSPVLANLAALQLDVELQAIANAHTATYTRYVDDMTFSFDTMPGNDLTEKVRKIVEEQGFRLNDRKVRLTAKADLPEVTGLILKSPNPDVSKRFLKELKKDIRIFQRLTSEDMMQRGIFHASAIEKLKASVQGQLQFLAFIRGKKDKIYREMAEMVG